jgi:coproporphyrinogen III oxidase
MQRIYATADEAKQAYDTVSHLQSFFVKRLDLLSKEFGSDQAFKPVEWFRDGGEHGGGVRFVASDDAVFNRASVNISQVQYENMADKSLASATAISTIIHPFNPHAPSIHMHISWTQLKTGKGYWRIMADLNPSIIYEEDKEAFTETLKQEAKSHFEEGRLQGERYFNIPVLQRHRGVSHFYLENFNSGDFQEDRLFALNKGEKVIERYIEIVTHALKTRTEISEADKKEQLAYHSLYLFQVLTLDRGTTSGLLVHDQNDVGIMGSIPRYVDVELLRSWIALMPEPQDLLLGKIVEAITTEKGLVDDTIKARLATVVRKHYMDHPHALKMQASGNVIPDTVGNHKS